jgi:hypothetical protein
MVKELVAMVAEGREQQEGDIIGRDTERQRQAFAQARIAQTRKTEAITQEEEEAAAAAAGEKSGSTIVSSSSGGAGEVVDRGRNKRRARGSPHVAARNSKSSKKGGAGGGGGAAAAGSGERREPVCGMASAGKRSSVYRGVTRWWTQGEKNSSNDWIALLFRFVFSFFFFIFVPPR